MTGSNSLLHRRSDGFVETADGRIAVSMRVMSAQDGETRWFQFITAHGNDPFRVEWHQDDKLQVFPADICNYLLRSNFAAFPTDEAIAWYEELMAAKTEPATPLAAEPPAAPAAIAPQGETPPQPVPAAEQPPVAPPEPPVTPPEPPVAPVPAPAKPAKAPKQAPEGEAG